MFNAIFFQRTNKVHFVLELEKKLYFKYNAYYHKMLNMSLNKTLLLACLENDLPTVKLALKQGADINNISASSYYDTKISALSAACLKDNLQIVQYLLESTELKTHADIHFKNGRNENLLLCAMRGKSLSIVKYFLESKNYSQEFNHESEHIKTLNSAANYGTVDILKYLLNYLGTEKINGTTGYGDNIFLSACSGGNIEVVKYLLTSPLLDSINIYEKNSEGDNALMCACKPKSMYDCGNGHFEVFQYLLETNLFDKFMNDENKKEQNVLMQAIKVNYHEIYHYLLIEKKFNVSEKTLIWLKEIIANKPEAEHYKKALDIINTREQYDSLIIKLNTDNTTIMKRKI